MEQWNKICQSQNHICIYKRFVSILACNTLYFGAVALEFNVPSQTHASQITPLFGKELVFIFDTTRSMRSYFKVFHLFLERDSNFISPFQHESCHISTLEQNGKLIQLLYMLKLRLSYRTISAFTGKGGRKAFIFIFCRSSECSPDSPPTSASSHFRPSCSTLHTAKEMFHEPKFKNF